MPTKPRTSTSKLEDAGVGIISFEVTEQPFPKRDGKAVKPTFWDPLLEKADIGNIYRVEVPSLQFDFSNETEKRTIRRVAKRFGKSVDIHVLTHATKPTTVIVRLRVAAMRTRAVKGTKGSAPAE